MPVKPLLWTVLQQCLRLFVGSILLTSALGKSLDLPGFIEILKTYHAFPDWSLWPIGLTITAVEWVLGCWILSGWNLPTGAFAAMMLNAGYAGWMTITLLDGLELPNCGCFGVFFPRPLRWYSPLEDVVLVGLCWVLYRITTVKKRP